MKKKVKKKNKKKKKTINKQKRLTTQPGDNVLEVQWHILQLQASIFLYHA